MPAELEYTRRTLNDCSLSGTTLAWIRSKRRSPRSANVCMSKRATRLEYHRRARPRLGDATRRGSVSHRTPRSPATDPATIAFTVNSDSTPEFTVGAFVVFNDKAKDPDNSGRRSFECAQIVAPGNTARTALAGGPGGSSVSISE